MLSFSWREPSVFTNMVYPIFFWKAVVFTRTRTDRTAPSPKIKQTQWCVLSWGIPHCACNNEVKDSIVQNTTGLLAGCRYGINPLKPNDPYRGHTAPLTPKHCILYIYSTNIGTEYFKHGIYLNKDRPTDVTCFIFCCSTCFEC